MDLNFPIKLVFKLFAFVPQIFIYDMAGNEKMYIYQRYWKIKEKIEIFSNSKREQKLYEINADRIIDFSPIFTITNATGAKVGAIKRYGMKSILKGYYEIMDSTDKTLYKIVELNPLIKFIEGILNDIPFVGIFLGLFLHPKYAVQQVDSSTEVARIEKSRSFAERIFNATESDSINKEHKELIAISMIMIALMERRRG